MTDFLREWFNWFQIGVSGISMPQRERFFSECGHRCADADGVLDSYRRLYRGCGGNLDAFFGSFNKLKGIAGFVIESNRTYEMVFYSCICRLHDYGLIHSPDMCECSRQSIIYILTTLIPNMDIKVKTLSTVLSGATECRFRVTMQPKALPARVKPRRLSSKT